RQYQLGGGRERRLAVCAPQSDRPLLERLAQRVERARRELRAFVEEQDAAMGERQRARLGQPAAAADERGHRGRVVRRLERWPPEQRTADRQRTGDRVQRRHLERGLVVE